MPNPLFAPAAWAVDATYTVTQSDFLALDIRLEDIGNAPASVILTVPAGAIVHALRDPVNWATPGTQILDGVTWQAGPHALGNWSLSVNVVGAATDPQTVTISNPDGTSPDGILRLLLSGLGGAAATAEPLGGTLSIDRLIADPNIDSVFSTPTQPIKEGTANVTLGALTSVAQLVNPAPVLPLSAAPALLHAWAPEPANALAVKNFTPAGISATFDTPAVYANTGLNFDLTVTLDLNGNAVADAGEPTNAQTLVVAVETVVYGMALVVDRSGSMGGNLGSANKWIQAVNSAHAWLDLFAAFRPGGSHRAGVMTFQNDSCTWSATPDAQLPFLDPSDGTALTGPDSNLMQSLDFFENIDTWNLGNVASCTPIGDGLVRAWEAVAAQQQNVEAGAVILLTDGYENSGSVTIEASAGNAAQTFDQARAAGNLAGANTKIGPRIFALGVGQSVQSDRLEILAAQGHYAQINDAQNLLNALAEMLGAVLSAERAAPLVGVVDPMAPANALYYPANTGEQVLAILVPLPTPGDTISVAWRPQGQANFVPINLTDPHLTLLERTNHILLRVDLTNLPQPTPFGSEWRVQRLSGGTPQPQTDADVLVMVDLHVQTEMYFGKDRHFIEEPIDLFCRIRSGGTPVTDAEVLVDVARPGESLGTFLATNAGRYKEVQGHTKPGGPDPATGKAHMISTVLQILGHDDLTIVDAPDFVLHDDGAHGDGPVGNGVWANSFADTALEGTYTFRFRVRGTLPDGSIVARTILKSIYLAVKPSLSASIVDWVTLDSQADGMAVSLLTLTPKSAGGQFLGPFRADTIALGVIDGTFQGGLVDNLDGSYVQRVVHKPDTRPVVSIDIYGTPLKPSGPGDSGTGTGRMSCWAIFVALLCCIWRAIKRILGIR